MKGYVNPPAFTPGICFICKNMTNGESILHIECALAYAEEKQRRIDKASKEARGQE